MKRIIVFCFLLASFLFMYGQFENTVITVSDAIVEVGDTFEIEVSTTEVLEEWDVIAFQFDLGFDNELLQYEGLALGEMPSPSNLIANEYEPGILRVAYANYVNISGAGSLVTVSFTALADGETALDMFDFKYNSVFLEDDNQIDGNVIVSIPNPFSDVEITVGSPVVGLEEPFDLAVSTSELVTDMGAISFQFELTYDTSMMSYTGSYSLGEVPNPGSILANETEAGVIAVAYANVSPISGAGTLCTLEFQPVGTEGFATASLNSFRYNSFYLMNLVAGEISFLGGPQEVELSKDIVSGWNWFSVNVAGEDMGVNSVLSSIGESGANIKNQSQSAIYYQGAGWYGSLNTINNLSLYKLEANDAATWEYTGVPVDLAETTYDLNAGWNWVSYAPQEPEAINYALAGLENGANIKNQSQSAIYYEGAGWYGSLNTLQPTAGYMLQMNDAEQHNYPEPEENLFAAKEMNVANLQTKSANTQYRTPSWSINPASYENNGFIWGVVEVDGVQVDDVTDWIGAFVGDECRGLAEQNYENSVIDYTVPFGHVAFMPMVYSNVTSGETITFKYYDASEDAIYDVISTVEWSADMVVGGGWDPFVFEVSTTGPVEPHFETVWTGDLLYPHNITVVSATVDGMALEAGDEVAVFDVDGGGAEICVGVAAVEGEAPYVVSASWDSYLTPAVVDGYVIGHEVIYKIWDASASAEITEISSTPIPPWDGNYVFQGETQVVLEAGIVNLPPVADAGEDQTVTEGDIVQLDGSGSYDPDAEESREVPDWTINPPDFEYNGSIWGIVMLDGVEVTETTGMLGCFVGEECRGIAVAPESVLDYTVPFGHTIFLPMVYSNETSGETFTFKYWDAASETIYNVEETIEWTADMVVGDGFNPFEFTVNTMPTSDLEFLWTNSDGIVFDNPTSIMPSFTAPDVTETTEYTITLIVSDGEAWSEPDEVVITVENGNIPPVADAGEDQTVIEGDLVQLDGTGSYDPDGEESREVPDWTINPPDYEYNGSIWGIVELDGVEVTETTGMLGCFVGDECRGIAVAPESVLDYTIPFGHTIFLPMVYSNETSGETFTFKYWDAASQTIYDVNETIDWVADMVVGDGFNPFVFTVTTIVIPDLDFLWTAPAGVVLSNPTSAIPTFIAPDVTEATDYVITLLVSDGESWSIPDEVVITVENSNLPPIADAGEDQTVIEGDLVQLDGTGSYDPDGEESREVPDWTINPPDFEYNGSIWGIVELDGVEVTETTGMLGCFVGDECRGIAVAPESVLDYTIPFGHTIFLPMVYSNETSGETFTFKYWDAASQTIYDVNETIEWTADMVVGDGFNPFVFTVTTIVIPDLDFVWGAPEGIILSDPTSAIPTFIAPEVEEETPYTITLIVSDGEAWSEPDEVVITVQNGNAAPEIELPDFFTFEEDMVLTIDFAAEGYISDPDLDPVSLYVEDNEDISVVIDGTEVSFSAEANWNGTEVMTFIVDDNTERLTASDEVLVIVEPVNDAPEFTYAEPTIEFNEDASIEVDFAEYISDVDEDELAMYVNGADDIIFEIDGFVINFSAEANWNGTDAVVIGVTDNQGRDVAEVNVDIVVLPVNDAPTIELPEFAEIEEDTEWEFDVSPYAEDIDGDILEVSNISIYDGNPGWEFSANGMMVYITPPENFAENVEIRLTVTDNVSRETAEDMMWLNILPVNDAPYILMELPDLELMEDFEMVTTDLLDHFADVDGDILAFEPAYNEEEVMVSVVDNMMYIESVENWVGTASVTINASDGQERDMVSDTFEIVVIGVNDPPYVYNEIPDLELEEDFEPVMLTLSDYFADPDGDLYNYWAEYNEDAVMIEIVNGELTISSIENWNGELDITVFVDDNMRVQAEDTFHLVVNPVNDAPVIELPDMFSFAEDGMLEEDFAAYIEDVDEDDLMLEAAGNIDIHVEIEGLMVAFSADANWNGEEEVVFTVYDEFDRLIAEDAVMVEVTPVNDAPVIELPEMLSFAEDGMLEEDFSGYISDVDGDDLVLDYMATEYVTVSIVDQMVTFSAAENWNGEEVITFTVDDGYERVLVEDMVLVEVVPVNDAPVIELPEMLSFEEDGILEVDFAEYVSDVDGDDLVLDYMATEYVTVSIVDQMVTFSAAENWNGEEVITFTVDDGYERVLVEDMVLVEVTSVNDLPVAMPGGPYSAQASVEEIAEVELNGSESYDIDGEIVSWEWSWEGGSGSGETILAEFGLGETVVTLTVTDNEDGIGSAETTVVVSEHGNIAPIAMPDEFTGYEDDFLAFDILYNDEDPDEYPEALTVEILTEVSHGELTEQYTGFYNYVPEADWNGEDFFTYRAFDGMAYSLEVQVSLTIEPVNDAPEMLMSIEDLYLEEDFSAYMINLEEYFTDIDTQELIYNVEYNPEEIMMAELRGGIYEITSVENWNGETIVAVNVSDGEYAVDTQFTVFVEAVNDAPTIELPEMFSFEEDGMLEEDFSAYVDDVDGDVLMLGFDGNEYINIEISDLMVIFTAEENWNGMEDITFMVYDEYERLMAEDVVTVEVTPVNDAPTIELPEMFSFEEDGMLEEDFAMYIEDIDSQMLMLESTGNMNINVEINELMVTFTAGENWNGMEDITFMVYDEYERLMAEDVVTVEVTSINDNPVAEANGPYYGQADEEGNAEILLDGSGSYDIDGDIVDWEWTWEGGQTSGETVMAIFPTGAFEVELTVTDNEGGFATDTAMVTVSGYVNIPPVAEADAYEGDEDTVLYGNVLYNDYDEDQYPEALTAELVTDVNFGELVLNSDGEFEYMPNENWYGEDSFEYMAFDGIDYSETVVVELTVLPVNDSPELVEQIEDIYLQEDFEQYQFDISGNFIDVDEDELIYSIGFAAEEILLVNLGSGLFALESVENWNGESQLEVSVTDGEYTVETNLTVFVEAVNDDPSIELPETFTMDEGVLFEVDFAQYVNDIDEDELMLEVTGNANIGVTIDGLLVSFDSPAWYGEELMTFTVNDDMGRAVASDDVTVVVRPALFEAMITIDSETVLEEETFEISVSTSEVYDYWNVISFEFDLEYDSESYEYVGYSAGEVPNVNGMLVVNNSAPGVVAVAYADAMVMMGAGELITFEFLAVNAGITEAVIENFRYNSTVIENIEPGVIEVIDVNHPPVADAGEDIEEYELVNVTLNGSESYDPDGQDITYLWTVPEGIELDDPMSVTPSFMTPEVIEDTEYVITLTVSDGEFEDSDEVLITVLNFNHAPEANAGEDQTVNEGELVQLDGSMSFDIDNDVLVFSWEAPEGIFLDNTEGPYPVFMAPAVEEDTDYEIELTVSDGEYEATDTVIITVLNAEIPDIEAEISVSSGIGEPGEPVNIDVLTTYLDPIWNIFSFEFYLAFNDMQLLLDDVSLNGTIVDPDGELIVEPERGVVYIKFVSQVSSGGREFIPISGEGSLINLEFTALTGEQAEIEVYDFLFNEEEEIEVVLPGVINNNEPYVAVPIPDQVVFEDFAPFTLDLNTFISDLDGDVLTYTVESGEGIVTEIEGSILEISSVENYNGEVIVTVTAWDGYSDLSEITTEITVIVTPVNDAPVIELPEEYTFEEDGMLEVDFTPYISDVDEDELVLTAEENSNVMVEIDGFEVTFSALENYNGTEQITFTVDDGMMRDTASDIVSIIVTSVNDMPVAEAGAPVNATAGPEGTAMVLLDGSDSYDIDGEIIEYHWEWNTEEAFGETAEVEFTPGNYTVTLTVTDNETGIDQDNVQVSVAPYGGEDPIAYPDAYEVDEDMILTVGVEEGILANDVDDGYPEPLTAIMIEEPAIGTIDYVEENWDGSFVYTAPENWFGEVTFEYVASDGNLFSEVTEVTITVNSINDLPVAEAGGPYTGEAGVDGLALITLSGMAEDLDGEIVLYEWFMNEELLGTGQILDVSFASGEFEVTLVVTDNEDGVAEDFAQVTVSEYENIAPVAEDDYYSVNEDEMLIIDAANGVLANDYDPDNYPEVLSSVFVDQREFALNSDGSFEYTPEADFNGTVYYEYYVTDGESVSETAMIYIEILPVNDAPEINLPAEFSYEEDAVLEMDFAEYVSDIDSEFLSLSVMGNEMVTVEIEEFNVTFGAVANWYGEEVLTFTVSDNEARLFDTDDVQIVVTAVNDAPVISEFMPEESEITIYDNAVIEFYVNAEDIDSDLEYTWTINEDIMPIMGNIFTPEFTEAGEYIVNVDVTDGEYTEGVSWTVNYLHAPDWQVVTYDNLTTAYGYVTVDGLSADEGDMIGAFVDEECRGMGTVDGTSRVNFNIFGDEVEVVNFKFWDEATDTIYEIEYFTQTYPGGEIGSIEEPLPLSVDTGVGPGWVPVVYTNSTIVYAIVTIEDEEAETGDLVAAFVGDECRAVSEVQVMERSAIASMVVQGEAIETIHFRIWDSSENIIYNVATTTQSNPGGVVGYPPNEILLNGSNETDVTQTLNLSGGWNLVSLYVRPVDMDIEVIFDPIMENLLKVKDIYSSYDPSLPPVYNTLTELEDGAGYYVKVSGVSTLEVTGSALDPEQTELELNGGWNLVAYINQNAMAVEEAFAELIANETLEKVKDIFSSYDPDLPSAYNTLVNMEPGKGYYLRLTEALTFSYPLATRQELEKADKLEDSIWNPVVYTNSMITYVAVDLAESEGMIVGSFVEEECRGIARIRTYNDVIIATLVINGENSESISFKIYDPVSGNVFECNEMIVSDPGTDYNGMPVLTVFEDNGVVMATGLKEIYPNPFNPETNIKLYLEETEHVSVKVFNVKGQLVKTLANEELLAGEHTLIWNGENEQGIGCTSGVYFIRLTSGSTSDVQKAILMK